MASTYTTSFRLELQGTGENSSTWGTKLNTNWTLIESAIDGWKSLAFASDANKTLTSTDAVADEARYAIIKLTGAITATRDVIIPLVAKKYKINNATSGSQSIRVIGASGTGITVPNGKTMDVYCDGTNVLAGADYFIGPTISGALTYGGVALTAAVTGTGKMVLDTSPTIATPTVSGALTYGGVALTAAVTGTGKMVLDTSPTLVTPALGTPASGNLSNCTGFPATSSVFDQPEYWMGV